MKKVIGALAVCALLGAAAPAGADASTYCGSAGYDVTRGGYEVSYSGARASGMNCASVRYAMRFFRRKVRSQYGYPRMPRAFYDGYVTWDCWKSGGHRITCYEDTTATSYSFRAWVW
jgi:hypothetical protein